MTYNIIQQNRKTMAICVDEEGNVIVKVPKYLPKSEINKFIVKNETWIKNRLQNQALAAQNNDWRITNKILYLGEYRTICIKPQVHYKGKAMVVDNELIIEPSIGDTSLDIKLLIENLYRQEAHKILTELTEEYAALVGVKYTRITIRKQKTRWGSCSSKGNLSYNVKILCAPTEMIEYIVLHEVMHLKYFNHGSLFWKEIEEVMPDYKKRMNYFKQFGQNFRI